jgi:hypothetical protein
MKDGESGQREEMFLTKAIRDAHIGVTCGRFVNNSVELTPISFPIGQKHVRLGVTAGSLIMVSSL